MRCHRFAAAPRVRDELEIAKKKGVHRLLQLARPAIPRLTAQIDALTAQSDASSARNGVQLVRFGNSAAHASDRPARRPSFL